MLPAADLARLAGWAARLVRPPRLVFLANQRPESRLFQPFLEALRRQVPQWSWRQEDIPDSELPGLALGDQWRFHAVPEGRKLKYLEEIIFSLDGQPPALPPDLADRWARLPLPPAIQVFMAEQCPYCPQVLPQLLPLARAVPPARLQLIEAPLFLELARQLEIKAVPTIIVNGLYRLTGVFSLPELLTLAEQTDPAQMPPALLEQLLKEGQAGEVGELMVAKHQIFPNFPPFLLHPELNIRLGAMVAWETVAAAHPDLVPPVLTWLWEQLPGQEKAVQGDIIYLLGEWGDRSWLPRLAALKSQLTDPELQESLEEATARLRERFGDQQE